MVVEYIRYAVTAERCEAFERAYEEAARVLELDAHCMAHEVACCVEHPTNYIVRLEWDSIDGHERGFRSGPHFGQFFAAVKPFLPEIEEMRHYTPSISPWRRVP